MKHIIRLAGVASALFILSVVVVAPAIASADRGENYGSLRSSIRASATAREHASSNAAFNRISNESSNSGIQAGPITLCPTTITAAGISVHVFLPGSKNCGEEPQPPEAPTLSLSADPTTIDEGNSSLLEWDSSNTDSCTASDGWSGDKSLDGSQQVTPSATTTYTLTCEGEGGEVSKSVTVNVTPVAEPQEPTLDFTANPGTIEEGAISTLEWDSTNADTCTASDGWSGSKALDGSQIVSPSATTTYTLECAGDGGTTTESITVNVTPVAPPPAAPTLDFTVSTSTIDEGSTTTLMWDSSNTNSCTASDGWSGSKTLIGSQEVSPTATTTYTLACEGDGGNIEKSVTVNVIPAEAPAEGKFLITEVYYDADAGHGSANGEWVELHNGTNSAVNLSDYSLEDNTSSDVLPDVELPAGGYAVITSTTTTASLWSIPESAVVAVLGGSIGNGLGNGGDELKLIQNVGTTTIDALSWGSDASVFDPPVPNVDTGHSIARDPVTVDTDTAADWVDRTVPTPGE